MRILSLRSDSDPLPRAAAVGAGSAFAAVSAAGPAAPAALSVERPGPVAVREVRELRTWAFSPSSDADPAGDLSGWRQVAVPHCWSRSEPELADHRGPCWYVRDIALVPGRHHQLVFDSIDYVCEIFVDGARVACHEGGFTPVAVELPVGVDRVRVAVRVDDPVEQSMLEPDPLAARKRKIKGVFEFHDSRPGGGVYGLWWSAGWARRWGTGGLVAPVRLVSTGPVRLVATFVSATGSLLRLNWTLTNLGDRPLAVELMTRVDSQRGDLPPSALRVQATIPPGASRIAVEADVDAVVPWFPSAAGTVPQLYTVRTQVDAGGSQSDAGTVRCGARQIELPVRGEMRYQLTIDGRRVYVGAANHIPGLFLPELDDATLRRDVELAQEAGLRSLGLHAHLTGRGFYDAADERGLLVYQDLPLNLAHDLVGAPLVSGGPTFREAAHQLAAEMVYRLFNHPSVVYYCAHNEPGYQLAEAFSGSEDPGVQRVHALLVAAGNEEELDDSLVTLWEHVDPTRAALKASGLGRRGDLGDVHTYSGSLTTDPATVITDLAVPFVSEFGSWSPNFSAAESALGARGDWPPGDAAVGDWEQRTSLWFPMAMRAGRPDRYPDFPTWAFASQLSSAIYIKLAVESFRRRRWDPSAAHRYHLLCDHWGDAGAGVVDRHRVPQLQYWSLRDAHRMLLPIVEVLPSMRAVPGAALALRTWVVNDHGEDRQGELHWSVHALEPVDAHIVGVDDPGISVPFGSATPPRGDLVVAPRRFGARLAGGEGRVAIAADGAAVGPTVSWTPPPATADGTAFALRLLLETATGTVENWGAFVAAQPQWEAPPGLTLMPRFAMSLSGGGGLRVDRRWTGETVAEVVEGSQSTGPLPPDQYLIHSGGRHAAVDLYDDVEVDTRTLGVSSRTNLPFEVVRPAR